MTWFLGASGLLLALLLLWPFRIRAKFTCSRDSVGLDVTLRRFHLYCQEYQTQKTAEAERPRQEPAESAVVPDRAASPPQTETVHDGSSLSKTTGSSPSVPEFQSNSVKPVTSKPVNAQVNAERATNIPESTANDLSNERRLLQVLLTPGQERRLFRTGKRAAKRFIGIFRLSFPVLQVTGSFGDPYWNGIVLGLSNGHFIPSWEKDEGWKANGILEIRLTILRILRFVAMTLAEGLWLAFSLWRSYRKTATDPDARALTKTRLWILDKLAPKAAKGL